LNNVLEVTKVKLYKKALATSTYFSICLQSLGTNVTSSLHSGTNGPSGIPRR